MSGIYPTPIVLPDGLDWYGEMGGEAGGWVCESDGPGWWHISELDLSECNPGWPSASVRESN